MRHVTDHSSVPRRQALRTVGIGTTVALAGCLGSLNESGGGNSDSAGTSQIAYQDWMPAPETIDDVSEYDAGGIRPPAFRENKSQINSSLYDGVTQAFPQFVPFEVSFESMLEVVFPWNCTVARLDVSEQSMIDSLSESDFQKEGTNGDYSIYSSGSSDRRAAVNGNLLVLRSNSEVSEYDSVTTAIDTKQGATSRWVDEQEAVAQLTNAFDDWTVLQIGLGGFQESVISGETTLIDGETSTIRAAEVFESASAVPETKLERQKTELTQREGVTDAQLQVDGRVAVIDVTATTSSEVTTQVLQTALG